VPSALNAAFPHAVDRLVLALLAPDPERRPASAALAAAELERALAPRPRARLVAAASAAAALALGAVVVVSGGRMWREGAVATTKTAPTNAPAPAAKVVLPAAVAPQPAPPVPAQVPQAAAPPGKSLPGKEDLILWEQKNVAAPRSKGGKPAVATLPAATKARKKVAKVAPSSLADDSTSAPVPPKPGTFSKKKLDLGRKLVGDQEVQEAFRQKK
jgi:hypothetical protein